jgi:orotidine-5'-phosphate decarboxylase
MAIQGTYLERLGARIAAVGTTLCLGVDPDPEKFPDGFRPDRIGLEHFSGLLLEAALPVTLNPYLGRDALEPFLARGDRFAYVLCRTSNAGAAEFQGLNTDGEPLYLTVARHAADWARDGAPVGLVVGATAPAEIAQVRAVAPELPFLVPGLGAQGGDADAVLAAGPATSGPAANLRGGALLVNVSRGISSAATNGMDAKGAFTAIAAAAEGWAATLRC